MIERMFIGLTMALLLSSCSKPPHELIERVPQVRTVVLEPVDSTIASVYFPAIAQAAQRVELSFRVAGEISQVLVKEGDRVAKGQSIAKLDPTDYQLAVDSAQARFSAIDSQYRRSRPLVKKGLLAQSQFDEIAAQRQIDLADLELAKLRLSFTTLKAPFDGVIARVSAENFESVQIGQQVVNIHSADQLEILVQLPDKVYSKPIRDREVEAISVHVRTASGQTYPAQIKEFTTEPNPEVGTFTATLLMPMPQNEFILDGTAVEVSSQTDQEMSFSKHIEVPIEAVFNADGDALDRSQKFVWVLEGDTVRKQIVEVGNVTPTGAMVKNGLSAGDQVVVTGLTRLRAGGKVEVLAQENLDE